MKITLSKIHAIQEGQSSLHPSLIKLGAYAQDGFPIKRRHRLGRVIDAALSEIKIAEKHRNELVQKYAGNEKQVPANKLNDFFTEFNELLEVEVELPDMSITLDELGDNAPLSAIDLMSLDWIITETEETAQAKPKKSKTTAAASGD